MTKSESFSSDQKEPENTGCFFRSGSQQALGLAAGRQLQCFEEVIERVWPTRLDIHRGLRAICIRDGLGICGLEPGLGPGLGPWFGIWDLGPWLGTYGSDLLGLGVGLGVELGVSLCVVPIPTDNLASLF